ncbi:MAG: T9SS type A sorting domain-containing protein [Flavobacteriales bacterium]|nr:T9SS type A sorting domain-containing protein [Flavobacteriales bacterium]
MQTHSYWAGPLEVITSIGGIRRSGTNEFVFAAGYGLDSCTSSGILTVPYFHPVIGKLDSLGTLLDLRHYSLNMGCRNIASDVLIANDGGIISWGHERDFFVLKANPDLSPVWAKRFIHAGGIQFIKELPNGDLLAGMNLDTAGAVVARLDADGNFLLDQSYIRPKGMVHDAVIDSDGSFIVMGYSDSTNLNVFAPLPASFQPKLFMMKLNGAGDVQWCRGYYSTPNLWYTGRPSRIEKTIDSGYAILATLGYPQNNFFYRPFLMKTDLNGDTLWTSSMGSTGYDHYTADLLAHSDGGYMCSGVVWGDLPGGNSGLPYIYKTDSLGRFPCGQQWHPITVSNLFPADSNFTLTSVDGAIGLPAYMNDTIFDPIPEYNACGDYHTSCSFHARKFHVYPNPNTGRFLVEFADPLMAESYYSVYDALGKLLYQRPLPAGATVEEIDLSRFGRGTYVLKLTDPEGSRYERVVLE